MAMANPDDPARLAAAFARSHYRAVAAGETIALHVGTEATPLQTAWPARGYAFITAWDSDSERASRSDNERADGALVAELQRLHVDRLRAWAEDAQGGHHEEGWLVRDLPLETLDRLARRFGQDGVLAWDAGTPVRLRLYHAAPDAAAARMPFVDWVG
jgi:Protein of unknown function (DUF3293)